MDTNNLRDINNLSFVKANQTILNLANTLDILDDDTLISILKLKDRELISTFLENYKNFNQHQLLIIEKFINDNLEIKDEDFISDLIDFSSNWALNLNYKKLLNFLHDENIKNHFIILSTINYITENFKLFYIEEIVDRLEKILDNKNFFQNVQISAVLCLFRITHNDKYIYEVKDWFNDDNNVTFLKNKLKMIYYKERYFSDTKKIIYILQIDGSGIIN